MKKFITLSLLAVLVAMGSAVQAQKVAYVNIQTLIDTLPSKDSAELKLQKIAASYDEDLRILEAEIQNEQISYETKAKNGATQAQLELIQKNYQRLVQQYQETQAAGEQDMQYQRAMLLEPIVENIKKASGEVAKAKGYTHVFDNSAGIVLWSANTGDDITGAVIAYMLKN